MRDALVCEIYTVGMIILHILNPKKLLKTSVNQSACSFLAAKNNILEKSNIYFSTVLCT